MTDDLNEVQSAEVPDGFVIQPRSRGFSHAVGPFYSRQEANRDEVMAFRVAEHHANGMNNCHGGMLMSFADVAWGSAISNHKEMGWVTVRLTTDFLSGAQMGDWVEGSSEIIGAQDDLFTVRGRIWCGERTLMTGTGIYKGIRSMVRKPGWREVRG